MPRPCSVCVHQERAAIDAELVRGAVFRITAERFGTSATALFRHKAEHMAKALVDAHQAEVVAQADSLLGQVQQLRDKALSILTAAEKSGDLRTALLGVREARGCLELLAKLEGELDESPRVNVLVAPEWLTVRSVLVAALAPWPEARVAVARSLATLEAV